MLRYNAQMFVDDRGRLERIGESLEAVEEGLASSSSLAVEVLCYRLSLLEQSCANLSQAYLDSHPEIVALRLPTIDQTLSEPQPPAAQTAALARRALAVFKPLLAALPPPPAPRAARPNPVSRFDEVIATLRQKEDHLRAQGIVALHLFGSVARREDGPGSDVDLLFEVDPAAERSFNLLDQARLMNELSEALGVRVDFVERQMLRRDMAERVAREMVNAFGGGEPVGPALCGEGSRSTEQASHA